MPKSFGTDSAELKTLAVFLLFCNLNAADTRNDKDRGRQPSRHLPLQDTHDTQPSSPRALHQLDQGVGKGRHLHPRQSRFSR
jgi:hypothetical protein